MLGLGIMATVPDESPMEVDELASIATPRQSLSIRVPDDVIKSASEMLGRFITPQADSAVIEQLLGHVWFIIYTALKKQQLEGCFVGQDEFLANVERQGRQIFINSLKKMAEKNSWRDLFYDDVFRSKQQRRIQSWDISGASMDATEHAWELKFEGGAANVLLATISSYLDKEKNVYARQTCIVNSSGTGKSRMVDEVAKKVIMVPMCLRKVGANGFPPPDIALLDWFSQVRNMEDQSKVAQKLHGFLYALLSVLERRLKDIVSMMDGDSDRVEVDFRMGPSIEKHQEQLALTFRKFMAYGQSFRSPGEYRKQFYDDVVKKADDLVGKGNVNDSPQFIWDMVGEVREAARRLWDLIDPQRILDRNAGARRPLVILSFDESHDLTDNPRYCCHWTVFSELRRALRRLVDYPFFSLFLSTAGKFHLFPPETRLDPSGRIVKLNLRTLEPITEISFDALANPVTQGAVTLDKVTSLDWISRLGRPLFGTRNQNEVVIFAEQKLLNSSKGSLAEAGKEGILACLSVRFALEFKEDPISRAVAVTQVERHMRLYIAASTGFERLYTRAGSEPLLAEAAFNLMRRSSQSPARWLAHHPDLNCVDRGRRGELAAAMIIMQARDGAQVASRTGARWVSVMEFMEALLPLSNHDELKRTPPTSFRPGEEGSFAATFEHYRLWFNHVIKIEEENLFKTEHLWTFITRGAMIICKDNQEGVDIVLPVCIKDEELSPNSVTAILVQVKNSGEFDTGITSTVFDHMDPCLAALFSTGQNPRPVIRLVFSLAPCKHGDGVLFRELEGQRHHPDKFTTFDIWCAGLGAFRCIDDDEEAYQVLLHRSPLPFDLWETKDRGDEGLNAERTRLRYQMAPLTVTNSIH